MRVEKSLPWGGIVGRDRWVELEGDMGLYGQKFRRNMRMEWKLVR